MVFTKSKRKINDINDLLISDPEIDNYEASAKGLKQPALAPNTIYNLPEQEDTNESPDLTEGTCTLQKDVSTLHTTNLFSENKYKVSKGQQSLSQKEQQDSSLGSKTTPISCLIWDKTRGQGFEPC